MDNVTHSLIGLALGRMAKARDESEHKANIVLAMIASNAPDLDFFLSPLSGGGKLAYLLQHRGYTHTLLFALPQGLLLAWLCWLIGKKRWDFARLAIVATLGIVLHVVADFGNSYGVHPFFPVWNQWIYGDFMFIVEPMLWLTLLPYLYLNFPWKFSARALSVCLALFMLVLLWGLGFVDYRAAFLATLLLPLSFLAYRRWPGRAAPWVFIGAIYALFSLASLGARQALLATAPVQGERVIDVAMSPAPANPLCWEALLLTRNEGQDFIARKMYFSYWPNLIAPRRCRTREAWDNRLTAPIQRVQSNASGDPRVAWVWEFRGNIFELRRMVQSDCRLEALMHFVRIPYWLRMGTQWVAGDLRYDREPGLAWSEAEGSPNAANCPPHVPVWYTPALSEIRQ